MTKARNNFSNYPPEGPVTWPAARTHADGMKVDHYCHGPSLTDQSQADAANINVIIATYGGVHNLPPGARVPTWGDFTNVPTDRAVIAEQLKNANDGFMALPPTIRALAGNDLAVFLDMLEDDGARGELEKLGLSKFLTGTALSIEPVKGAEAPKQGDPATPKE